MQKVSVLESHQMEIAIVVAGMSNPSNCETLAESFAEGIASVGGGVTKIRLRDLSIMHFSLNFYNPTCTPGDDFCRLQELIQRADGIVFASPIWNFSVPAHLKNLIDRMGGFALDAQTHSKPQLQKKPFYFIFTGGAPMAAWKFLMHITTIHLSEAIKYYGGVVVGRHFEPRCMPGRGVFGLVVDRRPKTLEHMHREGARFAKIVHRFAKTGTLPWHLRLWDWIHTSLQSLANRFMYPVTP